MALATSNLSVINIMNALELSQPKAIFRNSDDSLKTTDEIWECVNRWGLSSYCPGTNAGEKINNLRSDRNLKYFKGYDHNKAPFYANDIYVNADGGIKPINVNCIFSDYEWYYYSKDRLWISIVSSYNHTGSFAFKISLGKNQGVPRDGRVTFKGEPKLYGQSDFVLEVVVSQDG